MTDHARAEGPPASPSLPGTPRNLRGERITTIVQQLNEKWNLGIKLRFQHSPIKASPDDIGNKVYNHIQQLCFQYEAALNQEIENFNHHAQNLPREKRLAFLHKSLSDTAKKCGQRSRTGTQNIGQPRNLMSSFCGRYTFS
jgi:hypothetical protein